MYDFESELKQNAADIEAELDRFMAGPMFYGPGVPPGRLIAAMRHGTLNGGKRLRPLLVRQAAAIYGAGPLVAMPAALAIELVHCYSLIHDDLPAMDDDDLRRGQPTVHKAFDEATAILAGDALLTHSFQLLATVSHPDPNVRMQLIQMLAFSAGAGGMVGGQMRDIEGETAPLDEAGIVKMQAMKTGALIRAAVMTGAMIGGADAEALERFSTYGATIGEAFQLADDLLDVTATPESVGKATGKDDAAGKQTLVRLIGVGAARARLDNLTDSAIATLAPFGEKADGLRATARYFAARTS